MVKIALKHTKTTKHNAAYLRQLQRVNAGTLLAIFMGLNYVKYNLDKTIALGTQNIAAPTPYLLAEQADRMLVEIATHALLIYCLSWYRHLNQP